MMGGNKMVIDLSWQDVPLWRLEQQRAADTSLTILVPAYKSNHFQGTGLCTGSKMAILYPGIGMTTAHLKF
jgi:hypothetical protein